MPVADKIVSLFEPHTDIIRRGKPGRPAEFGHKMWVDEVDGGIVSSYRVLDGNPNDQTQWEPSLTRHQELFDRSPDQMSGDRGMYSPDNEALAQRAGVRRVILPSQDIDPPNASSATVNVGSAKAATTTMVWKDGSVS